MHRKSLIRKLRKTIFVNLIDAMRGRRPKYYDFDKHLWVQK